MLLIVLDLALSLGLLRLEGGWRSAFYEYAMTSVMLPSFLFGVLGVVLSSTVFSLGFLWILLTSPEPASSLNSQVAALVNPWIVGAVVAVLADLLRRLERATARNLELAASEERWRIAREIHDGVAQQSYVLALGLETAVALAERDDLTGLQQRLPPLEKLARQALLEVRQYVAEGRPLMLGERSLSAALAGLAREFSTVTRVAVELDAPEDGVELSPSQQRAIYRLTQEALANVFKHANAQQAWVTLRRVDRRVELSIADDGHGIQPDRPEGFGLEGMRRRVSELGGTFSIAPCPGGGTILQASLPLEHGQ
jgi:signal transduction histidine kinase